ncbi:two-component system regulatory protein YycI [Paenibacillus sp. PL2-23]|uniref:two-component system regulatory protein YycI n=1 Tax=Paenibacillus sp. PL2-23 TaxID=2100729 RepID=UPI0030F798E6
MDWGRAKSVLIISFLMLNVLLGYQLWVDIREQLNANVNSAELPPDKVQLMNQKRISISANTNLPVSTPKLSDLSYLLKADSRKLEKPALLEKPVDSALIFSKTELIRGLEEQIPDIASYTFDLHSSSESVAVFHRMVEGRPMFNVKLELYISNLKITGFRQDRVDDIKLGEEQQVIPAAKVVASLIETYLEPGSVITDIQLGYHGQIFDSEEQVSAPSWRVMLEDGEVFYVHAISGEVATDGSSDQLTVGPSGVPVGE